MSFFLIINPSNCKEISFSSPVNPNYFHLITETLLFPSKPDCFRVKHRFQHALEFRHVLNPLKQTQRAGQHVPVYVALCWEGSLAPGASAVWETRPSHPNRHFPGGIGADVWGGRHNTDVLGQE